MLMEMIVCPDRTEEIVMLSEVLEGEGLNIEFVLEMHIELIKLMIVERVAIFNAKSKGLRGGDVNFGGAVSACLVDGKAELEEMCEWVAFEPAPEKPVWVVSYMMDGVRRSLPCGGTHVRDLQEIGEMSIPKVKVKKGKPKVSYRVSA